MLFALGSNGSGQLGIGHLDDVTEPTLSELHSHGKSTTSQLKQITAGGNHTLALFSSGEVYIAGAATGQTGNSDQSCNSSFSLIQANATLCAATWEASIICIEDGTKVLTCGKGAKGELGQGNDITSMALSDASPVSIPGLGENNLRVVDLAASMQHAVAVLADGSVYGWGQGRKGQLGEATGTVWTPRKIEGLDFRVVKAVCGREFTLLAGESREGHFRVLGSNKWDIQSNAPESLCKWRQIGASWGSILVLLEDGTIRSWGRDDHGQLAPPSLPAIASIATGSEHSLAISFDHKVIAWGWGEHGNCGVERDERGDVKHRWNELRTNEVTISAFVGAGCATSWIWI